MDQSFQAIQISDKVYWVGAIDWELRNFHGYLTSRGTTYNAFLIVADQVTLVDSVKLPFMDEMMSRIASVVNPSDIKHIISTHSEMDHSGCLPRLSHIVNPNTIIASVQGKQALQQHFHWDTEVRVVKDGERIQLGGVNLRFIETRMIHWPDSMFAYLEDDEVCFSNDAFGMHLASTERFIDQLDESVIRYEAAKYYANILLPLSNLIAKTLDRLSSLNINFNIIAPDHGPIWRNGCESIVDLYKEWSEQQPQSKVVIAFDTMWQSTAKMAHAIADGCSALGVTTKLMPLSGSHRSDVATEILDAGALIVGSPTINGQVYPTVTDLMGYIKGLRPKNMIGAAFGSYGWNGFAVSELEKSLNEAGIEVVEAGLRIKYVPDQPSLLQANKLGKSVAVKLLDRI